MAVVREQVIEQIERDLAALDLVAVDVAVHVNAGLREGGAGLGVVDGHDHDRPSLVALAGLLEGGEGRVGLGEQAEGFVNLVEGVVVVEAEGKRREGGRASRTGARGSLSGGLGRLGLRGGQRRSCRKRHHREQHHQAEHGELSHFTPPRSIVRASRRRSGSRPSPRS